MKRIGKPFDDVRFELQLISPERSVLSPLSVDAYVYTKALGEREVKELVELAIFSGRDLSISYNGQPLNIKLVDVDGFVEKAAEWL